MSKGKPEVITFKADESLVKALNNVPNRSQFIRAAVLAALENTCPLCQGAGILSQEQRRHWERFARTHHLSECGTCQAVHLVCQADSGDPHTH